MTVGIVAKFERQSWEKETWVIDLAEKWADEGREDMPAGVEVVASPGIAATCTIAGLTLLLTEEGGVDLGVYDVSLRVTTTAGLRVEVDVVVKVKDTPSSYNDVAQGPAAADSATQAAASAASAALSKTGADIAAAAALTYAQTSAQHAVEAQQILASAVLRVIPGQSIQAAIDAVSLAGGGVVLLAPGVYIEAITVKDNVIVDGMAKRSVTIKLPDGANTHAVQAGDFDANADGVKKASPVGCRSGGLRNVVIDGNKANQQATKHGIAYYGIDMLLQDVEVKNCKGWGIYPEAPGATFSTTVGQNLQYNWRGVEAHDSDLGNIYYNGQSDSTLVDVVAYSTGTGAGQANLSVGTKATGCRFVGLHCWGGGDYAIIHNGSKTEYHAAHVESAAVAKVWVKAAIIWHGGQAYEAGSNTAAPAFKLDAGYNTIIGVRVSNINGGLIDVSGGGSAYNRIVIDGYTSAAGASLYVGAMHATSDLDMKLTGGTTASYLQAASALSLPGATVNGALNAKGGIDMNSTGVDRAQYLAGVGWSSRSVSAGALSVGSSFVVLSEAAPADVTDITQTTGAAGIPMVTLRNSGTQPITFKHNVNKLRNISGADVALGQNQSITYTFVSGSVWQQTGGKQ